MKAIRYRIVSDAYCGYECQIWRLWWPFWTQMDMCNTHISLEKAKEFIEKSKLKVYWQD